MRTPARNDQRVRTDPRFTRRRRTVERLRRRKVLIRCVVVSVAAAATWAAGWSPLLDVRDVQVVGAVHTRTADVIAASGVRGGENLLLLSTEDVARAARALPWVADVDVDRMLPGTVRIKIEEREPAFVLSLGAARWTLDARGNVLSAGEARSGLPVLAGVQVATVEPGVRLETREAVDALAVVNSLPGPLRRQVQGVFAPTLERISLKLSDGTIVRYGAAEDIGDKNAVLAAVLKRIRAEDLPAAYVDVRVPSAPAISAEGAEPGADASPD
ncbi:MAG TPA: FtsQ-type POTRA domain-containing protein [Actinomycetota bacterium]|nr:FtsQ-type POTRA domain-containing protein [Actinomycetota bacterium]